MHVSYDPIYFKEKEQLWFMEKGLFMKVFLLQTLQKRDRLQVGLELLILLNLPTPKDLIFFLQMEEVMCASNSWELNPLLITNCVIGMQQTLLSCNPIEQTV